MPNQSRKSKIKGWITALIIIAILAAALIGAAAYYKYVYSKAYVQDVENLNYTWVLTPETTQGRVSESATQNVYLSSSDVLDKVFVAQGDRVEIGDALFQYDVEALQSNVEQASLDVDVATMKLNIEMIRLQNAVDIKPRPTDKEIEDIMDRNEKQYEEAIQKLDDQYAAELAAAESAALSAKKAYIASHAFEETSPGTEKAGCPVFVSKNGAGTEADPFVYTLNKDAIISSETIDKWRGKQEDPNSPGTKQYYYYKITATDGTETYTWLINHNTAPLSGAEYYDVTTMQEHVFDAAAGVTPPDYSSIKDPNSGLDFHGYTQEEKDKKVAEEQVAVLKAQTELKSMQHKLKEAQNKLDNATVRANMPGIVQSVGDAENPPKDGSPFVVITGESGMAVIGYVSELKLGSIKVGDEYTVYSWETGNTTTAKVAEISPYPAENFNSWTSGNSNVSWYPFTAYMESAEGFTPGFGVEMTPVVEEEEGEVIVLEKVYVRSDEKGNYVLKEDENGRLARADVTVKSTSEAEYLQILSGLSTTDRIAFPYGNKAVVGMKTTDKPPISLF